MKNPPTIETVAEVLNTLIDHHRVMCNRLESENILSHKYHDLIIPQQPPCPTTTPQNSSPTPKPRMMHANPNYAIGRHAEIHAWHTTRDTGSPCVPVSPDSPAAKCWAPGPCSCSIACAERGGDAGAGAGGMSGDSAGVSSGSQPEITTGRLSPVPCWAAQNTSAATAAPATDPSLAGEVIKPSLHPVVGEIMYAEYIPLALRQRVCGAIYELTRERNEAVELREYLHRRLSQAELDRDALAAKLKAASEWPTVDQIDRWISEWLRTNPAQPLAVWLLRKAREQGGKT